MFVGGSSLADYPPLPAFPAPSLADDDDFPTVEELQAASRAGDGWATFQLTGRVTCDREAAQCISEIRELVALAAEQGEPAAPAILRAIDAEMAADWRALATAGDAVCGQVQDGTFALLRAVTSIAMPGYGAEPRLPEEWQVVRGVSSDGAQVYRAFAGPVSLMLVYEDGTLKLARIFIFFLEIGSFEASGSVDRWDATRAATGEIAQLLCPGWSGLGAAAQGYLEGVVEAWPPRGVSAEAPDAWLFATGVTPDIFWLDLYVDPRHDPGTSDIRWSVNETETLALPVLFND